MAWTAFGRVGGIVAYGVVTVVLGALLDLAELGVVLFAQTVTVFASNLATAGENRIATILFSTAPAGALEQLGKAWATSGRNRRLATGTAVAAIVTGLLSLGPSPLGDRPLVDIALLAVTSALLGWQTVLIEALRGAGRVRDANLATGRTGGFVTLTAFLVLLGVGRWLTGDLGVGDVIALNAGAAAIGDAHLAWAYASLQRADRRASTLGRDAEATAWQPPEGTFDQPLATVASQLLTTAFIQADMLIAGLFLAGAPLGVFGVARRVAVLLAAPLQILNLAVSPEIARRLHDGTGRLLETKLARYAAYALAASTAGLVVALVAPDAVWELLADTDVDHARQVLAVLSVGQLVNVATGACGTVLLLSGRQREVARQGLIALGVLVAALAAAGLTHSALWLAAAASAVTALRFVWLARMSQRLVGVSTHARPSALRA